MLSPILIKLPSDYSLCQRDAKCQIRVGGMTVSLCVLSADRKIVVTSEHVVVGMHVSPTVLLNWGQPSHRIRSRRVRRGMVHVIGANMPVWLRLSGPADILVVSLNTSMIAETSVKNGNVAGSIGVAVAVTDWKIRHLLGLFERELLDGGGSDLYLESLGTALAVHLLRHYRQPPRASALVRGGIAPTRLRRVLEYVDAHLAENVPLADLATLSGLAFHHFAHAFKDSMGVSPHRFLIERRIARSKSLLATSHLSVAEIALMLGFTDQSHFTEHFRRLTGTTPARYRRNL